MDSTVQIAVQKGAIRTDGDDPSAAAFREDWAAKRERLRASSPYSSAPGWDVVSVIVKAGADMRQEHLACQLIAEMAAVWRDAGLPLWVYPFRVLAAAEVGGLVETVPSAVSLHSIKKAACLRILATGETTAHFGLRDHFIATFGAPDSAPYAAAVDAFAQSLAAYSIATYVLQVKDRHDGNILIDSAGHVVHIDFGFMLSNAPGYVVGIETAPFKLAADWIELLGGLQGDAFARFKDLFFEGFLALRKHADRFVLLVEALQRSSRLPCFAAGPAAVTSQLRARFHPHLTDAQLRLAVDRLVLSSAYSLFTRLYDTFQYYSNGIL
jgi:phosphatidylinositol 4-kinase